MDTHTKNKPNRQSWLTVLCIVSYVVTICCTIYIISYLFSMCNSGGLSTQKFIGFMAVLLVFFLVILLSNNRRQNTDKHNEHEQD